MRRVGGVGGVGDVVDDDDDDQPRTRAQGSLAARQRAQAYVMEPVAVQKLFEQLAPRFAARPGGYTRIQRTQKRRNDNADMAFVSYLSASEPSAMQRVSAARLRRPVAPTVAPSIVGLVETPTAPAERRRRRRAGSE